MQASALVVLFAPLAGLLLALPLYLRGSKLVHWPILASCAAATVASLALAAQVSAGNSLDWTLYRWFGSGGLSVDFGIRIDSLSASVLWMVCLVSALIHVYAVGYMSDDASFGRFFLYFHFFFFSMVGLLTAHNYLQMYMFWEGVGLASFLLIGFWYGKEKARSAAFKAFLTNRVGDIGFLFAVLLLWNGAGTIQFSALFPALAKLEPWRLSLAVFLLMWGATAKSAQIPLHVWLPDAMEGPTPVSALMHAATMVTAGVFLLLRSMPLLSLAPYALPALAAIGAATALLGALVACVKTDLKKILAYSTMSHLGLMMMGLGLGLYSASIFHLVVHGFFKALLFLCVGNVLHAIGKSSAEAEDVGGLREALPGTFWAFVAGAVSLSGALPLGGFFSKDRLIGGALESGSTLLQAAAVAVSVLSAYYVFRLLFLIFLGPRRNHEGHPHEAGPLMAIPVYLLAAASLAAGLLAGPIQKIVGVPLVPELEPKSVAIGLAAAWTGLAAAWLGVVLEKWNALRPAGALAEAVSAEFGWQAATGALARGVAAFADALSTRWDIGTWDRAIESLPRAVQSAAESGAAFSRGLLNDYLWWLLAGAGLLAWVAR